MMMFVVTQVTVNEGAECGCDCGDAIVVMRL